MHASHGGPRSPGVVYTPPEVTEPMTRVALEPLLRGRAADDILALRICDPAIGEGAFLHAAIAVVAEHLVRAGLAPDEARRGAASCVHGVDIAPDAVLAARTALAIGPDQLQIADALTLDWRAAYPTVFARGGFDAILGNPPYVRQEHLSAHKRQLRQFASYDGVADLYVYFVELAHKLARPGARYCLITPNKWLTAAYGRRLRGYLAAQRSIDGLVDLGRSALFDGADAFPCILWGTIGPHGDSPAVTEHAVAHNSHGHHHAVELAPSAGQLGHREPAGTATDELAPGRDGQASSLVPRSSLAVGVSVARFDAPVVTAAPAGPHTDAPSNRPIWAARLPPGAALTLGEVGPPHPRERWGAEPWHIDLPAERALIERLAARWPRLRDLLPQRPARGVVTGCNRAFVLDRRTRDRLLDAEPAAAPLIRPFVRGRDVRSWLPAAGERWILLVDRGTSLDELPRVVEHLAQFRSALEPRPADWSSPWHGRKQGSYRWYELQDPVGPLIKARAPLLLYQDIQTSPACCLDRGGDAVPDTTVWMLPSADLVLLAILNAPLYGWYARRRFPPALNGSVRPKLAHIGNFPVAVPDPTARAAIEALVTQRLDIEPDRQAGCPVAASAAEGLDTALSAAVHDAYELSADERALVAAT